MNLNACVTNEEKKHLQSLTGERCGWRQHLLPMLLILLVPLFVNKPYLSDPPAYIHAWAQSDNYSLAFGFLHNGGDLLHPQTLIYNKQQMGFEDPESLVTACDLPLHHWLAAGLMALTGVRQPWVFRGLTLAVSILGLWALYLLAFVWTRSRAKSLFVAMVTATAPSYAYYSASFMPTAPALALAMGGLFLYALYLRDAKRWTLYVSLLLLTLAMMERTSFSVLWVAVACYQVLLVLRREASLRSSWLPFVAGALLFVAWWLWSQHLRHRYGSLFLSSLLPVQSMEEAGDVFRLVHDLWRFHYFQQMQHWLFVVMAVAAVVTLCFRNRHHQSSRTRLSPWWLLAIWIFGELLFMVAMLQQYMYHDYYFLDSFFLPIVMLMTGLLAIVPNPSRRWGRVVSLVVVLSLTVWMTAEACHKQQERRLSEVETCQTAHRYERANAMLEEAGYGSRELRFLTLFSYPQNTPFVMMDREGYAAVWTIPKVIAHALTFPYDYILVEDEVYCKEYAEAPDVLSRLRRLAGNGEISVCTLSDSVLHETVEDFFTFEEPDTLARQLRHLKTPTPRE